MHPGFWLLQFVATVVLWHGMEEFPSITMASPALCTRIAFDLDVRLSNHDLYREFTLGPSTTCRQPGECAKRCGRHPQCSTFSFNQGAESCQLYGDVMYSDVSLAQPLPGERYFLYRMEWCPQQNGFFPLRAPNMCVKISTDKQSHAEALTKCEEFGARLTVLEDEDKATALLNLIDKLGLNATNFHAGADDLATEGVYMWGDGRLMIRDWWRPTEPDGPAVEDCAFIYKRGLYDAPCSWAERFICEIPE